MKLFRIITQPTHNYAVFMLGYFDTRIVPVFLVQNVRNHPSPLAVMIFVQCIQLLCFFFSHWIRSIWPDKKKLGFIKIILTKNYGSNLFQYFYSCVFTFHDD